MLRTPDTISAPVQELCRQINPTRRQSSSRSRRIRDACRTIASIACGGKSHARVAGFSSAGVFGNGRECLLRRNITLSMNPLPGRPGWTYRRPPNRFSGSISEGLGNFKACFYLYGACTRGLGCLLRPHQNRRSAV